MPVGMVGARGVIRSIFGFCGNEQTRIYFYPVHVRRAYTHGYAETQSFHVVLSVNVSAAIYPQIGLQPTFVPANNGGANNHVRSAAREALQSDKTRGFTGTSMSCKYCCTRGTYGSPRTSKVRYRPTSADDNHIIADDSIEQS